MKTAVSPEGVKVLGGLLAQAGDVGAARRVALEVAAALSEIDGVAMPGAAGAGAAVVVDAVGDLDWQATASAAGWMSPETAADLLAAAESSAAEVMRLSGAVESMRRAEAAISVVTGQLRDMTEARNDVAQALFDMTGERDNLRAELAKLQAAPAPVAVAAPVVPAPAPVAVVADDVPPVPCDASGKPVVAPAMWARMAPGLRQSILARESARGGK